MSIWMFVKTFGDICLYFSVVSAFPKLFPYEFSFLWPALLCGFSVAMADMLSARGLLRLRFLCLALPVSAFLLTGSFMEYLILALPVAYAAVLVIRNLNFLEYYSFRSLFKASIIGWCIYFCVICLLTYFENATQPWRDTLHYQMPLLCGLLYMLCGVMLLRQLRLGTEGKQTALNGGQMAVLLGTIGIGMLGLVAVERVLQRYATSILEILKKAILYIVTAPLTILTQLISATLSGRFEVLEEPAQEQVQYTEPPVEGGFPPPVLGTVEQTAEDPAFPWWVVALILVAMVAVLAVMAGAYRKRRAYAQTEQLHGKAAPMQKKRGDRQRSNRSKLRQIYRSFLKQQRLNGLKIYRHYTSADVQKRLTGGSDPEAAQGLRQVYLSARYDENREVTAQQLKTARDALKQIRNGKETGS